MTDVTDENDPLIVTITGDSGMGKTSLACTFPNPIYISTPGEAMPRTLPKKIKKFATCQTSDDLLGRIQWLLDNEHDFQTVIIDSVTGFEKLLVQEIEEKENKPVQRCLGGYGAGLQVVASKHGLLRRVCGKLASEKGMNIVFVAHADIDQIDPPDGDPYSRYNLRLNKKSQSPYKDDVDCVGYLKLQTFVTGDDGKKKAVTSGQRLLVCYATPANVSKNRLGINDDIEIVEHENPFGEYL